MARIKISKDIQQGKYKSYLGIRVLKLQKSILTLANGILDGLKALWILERDDNNKKSCISEVVRLF